MEIMNISLQTSLNRDTYMKSVIQDVYAKKHNQKKMQIQNFVNARAKAFCMYMRI